MGSTVTRVLLAGFEARSFTVVNSSEIKLISDAGAAGQTGNITLESADGAQTVLLDAWAYVDQGVISSLSPASGQGGTVVEIAGSSLLGGGNEIESAVVDGFPAAVVGSSDSKVTVRVTSVPAENVTGVAGSIRLVADSGAIVEAVSQFTYTPVPTIAAVRPAVGMKDTAVTISGTALRQGAVSITSVLLGMATATLQSESDTTVVVLVPDATATLAVEITLVASSGAQTTSDLAVANFTFLERGRVTSIVPSSGGEGSLVTLAGSNLLGGSSFAPQRVTLANITGSIVSFSSTEIVVQAGASPEAVSGGDVAVVGAEGADIDEQVGFTYLTPGVLTAVAPSKGISGTRVTLTGTDLLGDGDEAVTVTLDGVESSRVLNASQTEIVVVAPSVAKASVALGSVRVVGSTGIVVELEAAFEFGAPAQLAGIDPAVGINGTEALIYGAALDGYGSEATSVTLAGTEATIVEASGFFIRVLAGSGTTGVSGPIVVTTLSGAVINSSASGVLWNYVAEAVVSSVTPTQGSYRSKISILGQDLLQGASAVTDVSLAGVNAQVVSFSDTIIVVTAGVPSTSGSLVGAVVVDYDTKAQLRVENGFTYVTQPAISSVEPFAGANATIVKIDGVSLDSGSAVSRVTLAGVEAFVILSSNSSVTVQAGPSPSAAGLVGSVSIESSNGARVERSGGFRYVAAGLVSSVEPANGVLSTLVTISGTSLLSGSSRLGTVTLGGIAVQRIVSQNTTQVVVEAANGPAASLVDIVLVSSDGARVTGEGMWTYLQPSVVEQVEPGFGSVGTRVVLSGINLQAGTNTKLVQATVGGVVATIESQNSTRVALRINAGNPSVLGSVRVVLRADSGARVTVLDAISLNPSGGIQGVEPSSGQTGTRVTVSGERLLGEGTALVSATVGQSLATVLSSDSKEVVLKIESESTLGTGLAIELESDTGSLVRKENAFARLADGEVFAVEPAVGSTGTRVTLRGSEMLGGDTNITNVTLNGVAASIAAGFSDETIIVTAGTGPLDGLSQGEVVVTAVSGAIVRSRPSVGFSYRAASVITSATPSEGRPGARITIVGTQLVPSGDSIVSVLVGGIAALPVSGEINETHVVVVAGIFPEPTSPANTRIELTLASGAFVSSSTDLWTYLAAGRVDSVVPSSGLSGTSITVQGQGFLSGGTSAVSVSVGGVAVESTSLINDTLVRVVVGTGIVGNASLSIVSDSGAVFQAEDIFVFLANSEIELIEPARGSWGVRVTISGKNLLPGGASVQSVTLGAVAASIASSSNTQIVVRAGQSLTESEGLGDVVVRLTTGARLTKSRAWLTEKAAVISSVIPSSGVQGTRVTVEGKHLLGETPAANAAIESVSLDGIKVTPLSGNGSQVVFVAPNNSAALVNVTLETTLGGLALLADGFRFLIPPVISSLIPASGQAGTRVTVEGDNLLGGASSLVTAELGGHPASLIAGYNSSRVVLQADDKSGSGTVTLVGSSGSFVTSSQVFTYASRGRVLSIEPSVGVAGTVVTIQGERLFGSGAGASRVTLAGIDTVILSGATDTELRVRVGEPSSATANGTVQVISESGAVVEGSFFQYVREGIIEHLTPSSGRWNTLVRIEGSQLLSGSSALTSVTLAGRPATVLNVSATEITLRAGAAEGLDAVEVGDVVITAETGAEVRSNSSTRFTYVAAGSILQVEPGSGQAGARVDIVGDALCGAGSAIVNVTLAGWPAEILSDSSCVLLKLRVGNLASPITGNVLLTADTGDQVELVNGWTQVGAGSISRVEPSVAQAGQTVTIYGSSMFGGAATTDQVTLAGVAAQIVEGTNSSRVIVTVQSGPLSLDKVMGSVIVKGDAGLATELKDSFTYSLVTGFTPDFGMLGTRVTISGVGLTGASGRTISRVEIDGVSASLVENSSSEVVVTLGPRATSLDLRSNAVITLDNSVTISSDNVPSSLRKSFIYKPPGSISRVSPAIGAPGSRVTIVGSELFGYGVNHTSIKFGTFEAALLATADYNKSYVVVVVPDGPDSGSVDIRLESDTGSLVLGPAAFSYPEAPSVTTVTPRKIQLKTVVTIDGVSLLGGAEALESVTLGGVAVLSIEKATQSQVIVVANGTRDAASNQDVILVSLDGAEVVGLDVVDYVAPGSIETVSPTTFVGGARVTIEGSSLLGGSVASPLPTVKLGGVAVESVESANASQVVVVAGPGTIDATGVGIVAASGAEVVGGQGTFRYVATPVISSVTPASGQSGTRLTIAGVELFGGSNLLPTEVTVEGLAVRSIEAESSKTAVVVVLEAGGPLGPSSVSIISANGAVIESPDRTLFTRLADGSLTSVTPANGTRGETDFNLLLLCPFSL